MRITADDIDDEPVANLTRNFMEYCNIQTDNMLLNPSEEGAMATPSEYVDKQWVMKKISELKEDLSKELEEKVAEEVKKYFLRINDKKCAEDNKDESTLNSESEDKNKKHVEISHPGVFCDHCDCQISGIRYKCSDCEDFDLCEECETLPNIHNDRHVFLKIRIPLPVNPTMSPPKDNLLEKHHFDKDSTELVKSVVKNALKEEPLNAGSSLDINAEFVCDETVPNGTIFTPGENFVKKWRVRNTGHFKWDSYTTVRMRHSHPCFQPLHTEVLVPQLEPFQEGIITVTFRAPKTAGYFKSFWAFYYNDFLFGDDLLCKITVANLPHSVSSPFETPFPALVLQNWRNEYSQGCRMKHKSKEKHKKKDHGKKKVKPLLFDALSLSHTDLCPHKHVTSHTATPNNTPLYLTPPKSPEPKELTEVKKENTSDCGDNNTSEIKYASNIQTLQLDEKISYGNLTSSESDSEFVIIPMPKCFNLSEPYKTGHSESMQRTLNEAVHAIESKLPKLLNITQKEPGSSRKTSISDNESNLLTELNKVMKNKSVSRQEIDGLREMSSMGESDGLRKLSVIDDVDVMRKPRISKNVSQETGVPEHVENFFLCCEPPVIENKYLQKNINYSAENSLSSSSISIIDSSGNSSPTTEPLKPIPADVNQSNVETSEVIKPIIEISEAATSETASGTFPKFPVEVIDVENTSTNNTKPLTGDMLTKLSKNETASDSSTSNASTSSPSTPMQLLIEMGFRNNCAINELLLKKYENNLTKVVEELINMSDSDWSSLHRNE